MLVGGDGAICVESEAFVRQGEIQDSFLFQDAENVFESANRVAQMFEDVIGNHKVAALVGHGPKRFAIFDRLRFPN